MTEGHHAVGTDGARALRSSLSARVSGRLCADVQERVIVGPRRKAVRPRRCSAAPDTRREEGFHTQPSSSALLLLPATFHNNQFSPLLS